jgi:hypothetical protein
LKLEDGLVGRLELVDFRLAGTSPKSWANAIESPARDRLNAQWRSGDFARGSTKVDHACAIAPDGHGCAAADSAAGHRSRPFVDIQSQIPALLKDAPVRTQVAAKLRTSTEAIAWISASPHVERRGMV